MWCGKKLAFRVEHEKAYLVEVLREASRFTARHYRQSFKKAVDSKVFGKQFFSKIVVTRSHLARLCLEHNEPLPKFWFPDNEKYPFDSADGWLDEMTAGGRYALISIYDDTPDVSDNPQREQTTAVTVTSNAVRAAKAKHAGTNEIKSRFIRFFKGEGDGYPNKRSAAKHFFKVGLIEKERLLFLGEEAAIRTLLDALRADKKPSK